MSTSGMSVRMAPRIFSGGSCVVNFGLLGGRVLDDLGGSKRVECLPVCVSV